LKKISALLAAIILFTGINSWSESGRFSSDDIRNLEKKGLITRERADTWRTREGLIISGYDPGRKTRLEHIMKHTEDVKGKNRHGVFTVGYEKVIILMDSTWKRIRTGALKPSTTGKRMVYIFDSGEKVGYMGGRDGAKKGFPTLRKVRLVLEGKTPRVVTFYPI